MRYFLEVSYKGTRYAGFQIQKNANSIQFELEKALSTFYQKQFSLTGSSRTDAGVHALQNFFHADVASDILQAHLYNLNAILPKDIVLKAAYTVTDEAHCRFDAISRTYKYYIYSSKDAFLNDTAWFYPYPADMDLLNLASEMIKVNKDFSPFCKRNTQVNTFNCNIIDSQWTFENKCIVYNVKANRFLRGMVKALVATMLKVGRGKISLEQFAEILCPDNHLKADFSAPAHGLFLTAVEYRNGMLATG